MGRSAGYWWANILTKDCTVCLLYRVVCRKAGVQITGLRVKCRYGQVAVIVTHIHTSKPLVVTILFGIFTYLLLYCQICNHMVRNFHYQQDV